MFHRKSDEFQFSTRDASEKKKSESNIGEFEILGVSGWSKKCLLQCSVGINFL